MKINIYITECQRKNFKPTYLYIKERKITKLKYFGKTTKNHGNKCKEKDLRL